MTYAPRKILVRCPNWVGDVVMATPAIRALKERFPAAEVHLLLKSYVRDLVRGLPFVDGVVTIEKSDGKGLGGIWRTARKLRAFDFDLCVLLTNSLGTALEAALARIPRRVGFGDGRSLLLTDRVWGRPRVMRDDPIPMVDLYAKITAAIDAPVRDRHYVLTATTDDETAAAAWLQRHRKDDARPLVGLSPGAKLGASKLWDPARFAEVGDRLHRELGAEVLLLGAPGEEPLLAAIREKMSVPVIDSSVEIIRLGALKAVMRRLALLITTDTGPRAIAQAFDVPSVVVMGPTHPGWTAANLAHSTVLRHDVPCGPCHKKICDLDHRCMTLITVEEVVLAARGRMRPFVR